MTIIAIANQKGGVGKTTITFNLAHILAKHRQTNVLAIDNDPQGNLTGSFLKELPQTEAHILNLYDGKFTDPIEINKQLHLLGSDISLAPVAERDFAVIFKLKEGIDQLKPKNQPTFDYTLIDCLPSFGHLQLAALNAADFVLIPVRPTPYALAGMQDLFKTIEKTRKYFNPNLKVAGIIVNLVDGRRIVIEREMEVALRETYGSLVFKNRINKRVQVEESPTLHQGMIQYDPKSSAANAFRAVARELKRRINSTNINKMKTGKFKSKGSEILGREPPSSVESFLNDSPDSSEAHLLRPNPRIHKPTIPQLLNPNYLPGLDVCI